MSVSPYNPFGRPAGPPVFGAPAYSAISAQNYPDYSISGHRIGTWDQTGPSASYAQYGPNFGGYPVFGLPRYYDAWPVPLPGPRPLPAYPHPGAYGNLALGDTASHNISFLDYLSGNRSNVFNVNFNMLKDNLFRLVGNSRRPGNVDNDDDVDNDDGGGDGTGGSGNDTLGDRLRNERFRIVFDDNEDEGMSRGTADPLDELDANGTYQVQFTNGSFRYSGRDERLNQNVTRLSNQGSNGFAGVLRPPNIDDGEIAIGNKLFQIEKDGNDFIVRRIFQNTRRVVGRLEFID